MIAANAHGLLPTIELDPRLAQVRCVVLVRDPRFNVRQLLLPGGAQSHQTAPGELLIHCRQGQARLTQGKDSQRLTAGQVYLVPPHETCLIQAEQASSLLLTMIACEQEHRSEVDEASEESFPASDPPSWTGAKG